MIATLIVEDDYHVSSIHAAYIRRVPGFTVAGHAASAATALGEIRRLAPALVLLDLYLPDGHGLDLVRQVLEQPGPQPDFLVITAAREIASVRAALKLGTVHYLVKPFGFAALEERLIAYRNLHARLNRIEQPEQHEIDTLYDLRRGPVKRQRRPNPTIARIHEILRGASEDLSATEIAEQIGISRSTAQRYLAQLARDGTIERRLDYGAAGRPANRYRATNRPD